MAEKTPINRRTVLQAAGAAAGTGLAVNQVEIVGADDADEYHIGELHFVGVQMEYDEIIRGDGHSDVWIPPHVPEEDDGILTVGRSSPSSFRSSNSLVGFDSLYFGMDEKADPFPPDMIISNRSALAATRPFVDIDGGRPQPKMQASRRSDGTVRVQVGSNSVTASEQSQARKQLPQFTATHQRSGQSGTLTPHLTVTNYGLLDVYGHENAIVLPRNTSHPRIQKLVKYFEERSKNERVDSNSELLIVHER